MTWFLAGCKKKCLRLVSSLISGPTGGMREGSVAWAGASSSRLFQQLGCARRGPQGHGETGQEEADLPVSNDRVGRACFVACFLFQHSEAAVGGKLAVGNLLIWRLSEMSQDSSGKSKQIVLLRALLVKFAQLQLHLLRPCNFSSFGFLMSSLVQQSGRLRSPPFSVVPSQTNTACAPRVGGDWPRPKLHWLHRKTTTVHRTTTLP